MNPEIKSAQLLPLGAFLGLPVTTPAADAGLVAGMRIAAPKPTPQANDSKLNQRMAAVLRAAVEGLACDGADLYTLDDQTTQLELRVSHHRTPRGPGAAQRPLAKALADVAAMAGSAIVLEDEAAMADWPVPVWCGAAACLPVASDRTVYGSLWLYSCEPRTFTDSQVELAEVVAGRLAAELEIEQLREQLAENTSTSPASPTPLSPSQASTMPAVPAPASPATLAIRPAVYVAEEWDVAGWNARPRSGGSFYDWHHLSDGRLLVVAGSSYPAELSDASLVHSARIALRSLAPQSYDAGELLTQVNRTLWAASPGGTGLSLAVALLDESDAHASVALSGNAGALSWRASTCEAIPATCAPAGWSEQTVYVPRRLEVLVRQRLVLATTSDRLAGPAYLGRLTSALRQESTDAVRSMSAKRALRLMAQTIDRTGIAVDSLALVRRP
jgi:hypothetical protein